MPDFPAVPFELGRRSVVGVKTQMLIIEKVRECVSSADRTRSRSSWHQMSFRESKRPPGRTCLKWMRACTELGVTGVSLYPGTKHSTVTARGGILAPEEIKRGGTGHQTNAAFKRYLLPDMRDKIKIRQVFHQIRAAQPLHNQNQPAQILNLPKS
jgi:hypothetical protein